MTDTREEQIARDANLMIERIIDAAVDYERAEGIYAAGARRELNEARQAVEVLLRSALAAILSTEAAPSEPVASTAFDAAWHELERLGSHKNGWITGTLTKIAPIIETVLRFAHPPAQPVTTKSGSEG